MTAREVTMVENPPPGDDEQPTEPPVGDKAEPEEEIDAPSAALDLSLIHI